MENLQGSYFQLHSGDFSVDYIKYVDARLGDPEIAWNFPLHLHDNFLEISLIVNGEACVEYDHEEYYVRRGDLVIKNANVLHSEISSLKEPIEQYCVAVSGVHIPGLPPDSLLPDGMSPVLQTGDAFEFLLHNCRFQRQLLSRRKTSEYESVFKSSVSTCLMMCALLINDAGSRTSVKKYSSTIQDVLKYSNENYSKPLSLDELSDRFLISPYHLSRKFKQEVGSTINQYILNRRLGEAERMLAYETTPIKTISERCGYSSLQYFYSSFKKSTGMTPVEMRELYSDTLDQVIRSNAEMEESPS